MRTELNELLKVFSGPIEHGADLKSCCFPQLIAEFEAIGGWWLARKQEIGNCSKGKDIQVFTQILRFGERFRGHVGSASVFDEAIQVGGGGDLA